MEALDRFVEVGQGYRRDDFLADEDELIEYEDDSQDDDDEGFASDEATDSDSEEEEEQPFFQRMTRARARVQEEQAKTRPGPSNHKKRKDEPEEEDDIYLSDPESEEEIVSSLCFSLDRYSLSLQQLYEMHVQHMLKRVLYPRIDHALSTKSSQEYQQAQRLYADRLESQIGASLHNLAFSQAWRPETLAIVQRHPYMTKRKLEQALYQEPCDSCKRVHTVVSHVLFFWGAKCKENKLLENVKTQMDKKYHLMAGEEDADDIAVAEQFTMRVGSTCASRLKLYHKLYHRDLHMTVDLMVKLDLTKAALSSSRVFRRGKRVLVEPDADKLEKKMLDDKVEQVASKWSDRMNRAMIKCSDFTEGGKHVWSKRKDVKDSIVINTYDSESDDVYLSDEY